MFELFPYLRRKEELCCFLLTRQVYSFFAWSADKMAIRFLEVRRRLHVVFFLVFTWNVEFLQTVAPNLFVINKLRLWAKFFLLGNAEFTKRPLLGEQTGVVNNPSTTKLNNSKWKNAVLNPSKSFFAWRKVNPRILSTIKRSFSKKMGKNGAHTLSTRWEVNIVE